mmetsp:Transcript_85809/g.134187  ORF Transcript_85809/g.134187 Transcript_85809/m.134187 type:complete len:266 (+) Transcript_85809:1-798(+)
MRKYLYLNHVSVELADRTLRFFRTNYQACLRRVHESDLEYFKELPVTLQVALHQNIYTPFLKTHFLFGRLGTIQTYMCHLAMTERHFFAQQRVFGENDTLNSLYCVVDGRFDYYVEIVDAKKPTHEIIIKGSWMGEPCLWFRNWQCRGRFSSGSSSEVVVLAAEKFRGIIEGASASELRNVIEQMLIYARQVSEWFLVGDLTSDFISDSLAKDIMLHVDRHSMSPDDERNSAASVPTSTSMISGIFQIPTGTVRFHPRDLLARVY